MSNREIRVNNAQRCVGLSAAKEVAIYWQNLYLTSYLGGHKEHRNRAPETTPVRHEADGTAAFRKLRRGA